MAGGGPKKMGKRKRDRVLPREAVEAPLYKQAQKPVPADVFRASVVVYQAAAKMTMPAVNPEEYKVRIEGSVYALSDNPMNRGMLAVKEFLKPGNQSDLFASITVRLMSLLSAMSTMRADAKYARFFKPDL